MMIFGLLYGKEGDVIVGVQERGQEESLYYFLYCVINTRQLQQLLKLRDSVFFELFGVQQFAVLFEPV
ncbi:MAG: hypothetical protein J6S89_06170 [Paludibacteraceae bacterium]|nr:hypothetical protein [Paludibacteraceae bacterium]